MRELLPQRGERFLDLACGTGAVALRAARAGADVVGLDFSADQLAKARQAAEEAGLAIRFDEGDAQALPYDDGSFDAVASAFGVIFAENQDRAAAELARVVLPEGRIGVTAWPEDDWAELAESLGRLPPGGGGAREWSRPERVRQFLGEWFELRFERGEWFVREQSAEALWDLLATSMPTLKVWLEGLDPERRLEVEEIYLEFLAGGEFSREYVLILGRRR